jgi:hypothetical protein
VIAARRRRADSALRHSLERALGRMRSLLDQWDTAPPPRIRSRMRMIAKDLVRASQDNDTATKPRWESE